MKIKFYSDIVDEQERIWMMYDGCEDAVSFQSVQTALAAKPDDDKTIELVFNCRGGYTIEGWAIYDLLRQQTGCDIYATIEGECSSMATIILLAAPLENRKAYANAHMCIHNPAITGLRLIDGRLTAENVLKNAEQIKNQGEQLLSEQTKLLDTYVERTGSDRDALQALMDQDVFIGMDRAKELGFISDVLAPMTASKDREYINHNYHINQDMEQKTKASKFENLMAAMKELVGIEDSPAMQAIEVTDVDGNVLEVDREDGDPQVGDAAKPDGNFVMEDGTTIVVEGGVITAITPVVEEQIEQPVQNDPEPEQEEEDDTEAKKKPKCEAEPEQAEEEVQPDQPSVEELQQKIVELEQKLAELTKLLEEKPEPEVNPEDKAILDMVATAGGKDVVAKALTARSTFNASNTKVVDRKQEQQMSAIGDAYLEEQRAAHAAALAKIRR